MYRIGYLNGENVNNKMKSQKYKAIAKAIQSDDGFFLSEVSPDGVVDRLIADTKQEAFYGSGRTFEHTIWFFGKPGVFKASVNTTKYNGTMTFTGGSYERYACVRYRGVSLFGVHMKKRVEEYGDAAESLGVLVRGMKDLKAQAALLSNVLEHTGRAVVVGDFNANHDDRIVKILDKSPDWRRNIRHNRRDVDHCFTKDVRVDCTLEPFRHSDHPLISVTVGTSSWRKRTLSDMMSKLRW